MSTQNLTKHQPISRRFPAIGLYLSLIVLISGCYANARENDKVTPPAAAPAAVQATPVDGIIIKPAVLKEELEITGSLAANQQVDIVSELTRKIVRVNVKEGAYVQAGQRRMKNDDQPVQKLCALKGPGTRIGPSTKVPSSSPAIAPDNSTCGAPSSRCCQRNTCSARGRTAMAITWSWTGW